MAYFPVCKLCGRPMAGTIAVERPGGMTFVGNRIQCPHCHKSATYGPETVWRQE